MDNLGQLQHRIVCEHEAYTADFNRILDELVTALDIISLSPHLYNGNTLKLLKFVSHSIVHYVPKEHRKVDENVCKLLKNNIDSKKLKTVDAALISKDAKLNHKGRQLCMKLLQLVKDSRKSLEPRMRRELISATFLLRNKRMVDIFTILPEWLSLLDLDDRDARRKLFVYIVRDLTIISQKVKNNKVTRAIQEMVFDRMREGNLQVQLLSCCVAIEMHKRKAWNDATSVNLIAQVSHSKNIKIALAGIHFLLGTKNYFDIIFSSIEEFENNNKSAVTPKGSTKHKASSFEPRMDFRAIDALFDPQAFAEGLFRRCKDKDVTFQARLLMLNLVSILIARHKLLIANFYTFLVKYAFPKQKLVTKVLAIAAQAVHDRVPTEFMSPLVKQLIDQFISDDREDAVVAVGINAVREMAQRSSQVLDEDALSQVLQIKSKSKVVSMSLKALISLYREIAPQMLHSSLRGKEAGSRLVREKRSGITRNNATVMPSARLLSQKVHVNKLYDEESKGGGAALDGESGGYGDSLEQEEEADELEHESDLEDIDQSGNESDDEGGTNYEDDGKHDEILGEEAAADFDSNAASTDNETNDDDVDGDAKGLVINPDLLQVGSKRKLSASEKREQSVLRRVEKKRQRLEARSSKGKRQSTTNRIKARNKPALMTMQSRRVKAKKTLGINEKMSHLKRHLKNLKKGNMKMKKRRH